MKSVQSVFPFSEFTVSNLISTQRCLLVSFLQCTVHILFFKSDNYYITSLLSNLDTKNASFLHFSTEKTNISTLTLINLNYLIKNWVE